MDQPDQQQNIQIFSKSYSPFFLSILKPWKIIVQGFFVGTAPESCIFTYHLDKRHANMKFKYFYLQAALILQRRLKCMFCLVICDVVIFFPILLTKSVWEGEIMSQCRRQSPISSYRVKQFPVSLASLPKDCCWGLWWLLLRLVEEKLICFHGSQFSFAAWSILFCTAHSFRQQYFLLRCNNTLGNNTALSYSFHVFVYVELL